MTKAPALIWEQIGVKDNAIKTWDSAKEWGLLPADVKVKKGPAIFPRIDIKKEL